MLETWMSLKTTLEPVGFAVKVLIILANGIFIQILSARFRLAKITLHQVTS